MKRVLYLLVLITVLSIAGFSKLFFFTSVTPQKDLILAIPKGVGLIRTAHILKNQKLITIPDIFVWGVTLNGQEKNIKAGEYLLASGHSYTPFKLMKLLVEGDQLDRRLTLIEGDTVQEALTILADNSAFKGEVIDIPEEGTLFPDTYFYSMGDARAVMLKKMQQEMRDNLETAWAQRDRKLALKSPREALILASIVEKETGCHDNPARVAAVFLNRLRIGMPLQSDPTVIYALTEGKKDLGRQLKRSDLKKNSPYNTYLHKGLPPTAICNPGLKSIKAVMNPLETKELYFVADGKGGHHFAKTYAEHQRNHEAWRKLRDTQSNRNICVK